ncbi:MAG: head decoration protein [Alphaproteobacteria bacterium]|nr:head decoration protein [Alphaproteobacteria bacterium]
MVAQGFTDQGETKADNLLAGEFPRVSILATISGGKFERGTVLGLRDGTINDGRYTISTSAPEAILAEAVDASTEDKKAVIYLTGEFNKAALVAKVDIDELINKLRAKSIFVKENQPY